MNRKPRLSFALVCFILALLGACSKRETVVDTQIDAIERPESRTRDKVVDVEADDLEMNAAIAKARETLPSFWQTFEKRERGESDFCLKVRISDANGVEHFWVTDIERKDQKTMGTIDNDPNIVACVKLGDRIEIPEADISDWLYMRNDKMVGNETVRPLLRKLPEAEARRLREKMENP